MAVAMLSSIFPKILPIRLTSAFHALTSFCFPRRCEALTAEDRDDQTEEMLAVRVLGGRESSLSESELRIDLGELGSSEGSSGEGVRLSCLINSRGARDSASR